MTWQDKVDFDRCDLAVASNDRRSAMTPGLTNNYDTELREKAGMHSPPPPPECMGLEGEYDDYGLVRRVAQALDHDPQVSDIDTVTLCQHGGTVSLEGRVSDRATLEHIIKVVSLVDGTRAIDSQQLSVG